MHAITIKTDDLRGAQTIALLEAHRQNMFEHSPPECVFALDLDGLRQPEWKPALLPPSLQRVRCTRAMALSLAGRLPTMWKARTACLCAWVLRVLQGSSAASASWDVLAKPETHSVRRTAWRGH